MGEFGTRFVENATLEEIRKEDYAHKYKGDSGKIYWISGWTRPNFKVEPGDRVRIVYKTSPSYGLNFVEKLS